MFNNVTGNNEFIEIYNTSETETIQLYGYKIRYYTSNSDSIVNAGFGTILPPKSYAVIFEADYIFESGVYKHLIPAGALKLKIIDNAFGTNGMSNTSNRSLRLIISPYDTVDYYTYSANNSSGYSDEKILLNKDTSGINWGNSLRYLGSPGSKNSITPSLNDVELTAITYSPPFLFQYDDVTLQAVVKNTGSNTTGQFYFRFYNDLNSDSIASPEEIIYEQSYNQIASNDSVTATFIFNLPEVRKYTIIGKLLYSSDEDTMNNSRIISFTVNQGGSYNNIVVINEIMYAPSSGAPEWVELYNRSSLVVNIKKWRLSDNSISASITSKDILIEPGGYLVISKDSSIINHFPHQFNYLSFSLPQLNNTGDRIVLRDSLGQEIDSLDYLPSWGGNTEGKSLERINTEVSSTQSTNWGTTKNIYKGSPGRLNSLTSKNNDLAISALTLPPFGLIGSAIALAIIIRNNGILQSPSYIIKLYNDINLDSIPQPNEFIIQQNGYSLFPQDSIEMHFNYQIQNAGTIRFIILLESSPDDDIQNNICFGKSTGVNVNELPHDIVINEIMYAPESGRPEYIELFNQSNKTINLRNYSVADRNDTTEILNYDLLLFPSEYLVVSSDSSILNYYTISSKLLVKNFPSLNNTGDKVMILDSLYRIIDSLEYSPLWGGKNGSSLERIISSIPSIDSLNWKTSLSRYKGTPGYINTVSPKQIDIAADSIIFNPLYPIEGDEVSISVKVSNKGSGSVMIAALLYEDTNLDSIPETFIENKEQIFISGFDSTVIRFTYRITNLQNPAAFYSKLTLENDQDTSNNYIYTIIYPGVTPSSIIINEIMYAPSGGEPEWIELFNRSNEIINLTNWSISDVITNPAEHKIKDSVTVNPHEYLLLCSDSSIINYHLFIPSKLIKLTLPSLNNSGDGVVIRDERKLTIDSLSYSPSWGGSNGKSIERISSEAASVFPGNWKGSVDIEASTPGRINSVTKKKRDVAASGLYIVPRFPSAGDNIIVSALLKNYGSDQITNASAELFLKRNPDTVFSFLEINENISVESEDSLSITFEQQIINLQDTIYLRLRLSFPSDEDTLNNYFEYKIVPGFKNKSIVINEFMYDPLINQPEWVELYNSSTNDVDLKNWSISDIISLTEGEISDEQLILSSSRFLILASDTSFRSVYPDTAIKFVVVNFGTLGNISDGLILYDFRKGIIDSLAYRNSWEHLKGSSLERFSSTDNSEDSASWSLSISSSKSTPGKKNSISDYTPSNRNTVAINEIMFDPGTGNSEYLEFFNSSDQAINIGGWYIQDKYDNRFRIADSSLFLLPGGYFVTASDSTLFTTFQIADPIYTCVVNKPDLGLTTEETLILKDLRGITIDSISYSDKWHNRNAINKGHSLERINPNIHTNERLNWSTSVSSYGGTPSNRNSIYMDRNNNESSLFVSPNPFSPDGDGFEDITIINYDFGSPLSSLTLKIFDSKGRRVRTLNPELFTEASGTVLYDGYGDDGVPLRMGIYILLLEGKDYITNQPKVLKSAFVIARKLN